MAVYQSKTIAELISEIKEETILLPSIQRNFVWSEAKIASLFDSIMREYPIGTFLFWNLKGKQINDYVFNTFIEEYNEKNSIQRGTRKQHVEETASYIGVLDGQQRITSLYLGACGSFKLHKKGSPWKNDSSFIEHFLCIDIIDVPKEEEDVYKFALKQFPDKDALGIYEDETDEETGNIIIHFWTKVARVVSPDFDETEFVEAVEAKFFDGALHQDKRSSARKVLKCLNINFNNKENINFFLAKQTDLSQVVEIFVRVNSGGQYLAASDLILSIASGLDESEDVQKKMQDALDSISRSTYSNETGFEADKDLILTAGLMFTGATSLSLKKKENTNATTINNILSKWDDIIESLCNASKYIEDLGFDGRHLTSKNLILPIAYYLYKNNLDSEHFRDDSLRAQRDRVYIRQWLLRAMINSIFRDGIGSTLISIRNIIDSNTNDYFPLNLLMNSNSKRSLVVKEDSIKEILRYKYGDGRILPILIELGGFDSTKTYQIDHIWANDNITKMSKLKKLLPIEGESVRNEFKSRSQFLPNLELLPQKPNIKKSDQLFDEWLKLAHPQSDDDYYKKNLIPSDSGLYNFSQFLNFYDAREKLLEKKLKLIFPETFSKIQEAYCL